MIARLLATASLLWMIPGQAAAHLVSARFGELYSGMLHPLTALQHVVPWLALALLGGLQDSRTARWALAAFPVSVYIGVTIADMNSRLPYVDVLNLVSFIGLGLLVSLSAKLDIRLFLGMVVLFGLSHGYANGAPELNGSGALLYATGAALTAYLVIALISAATHSLASGPAWGSIAVRAVGSWIAAAGLLHAGFLFTAS